LESTSRAKSKELQEGCQEEDHVSNEFSKKLQSHSNVDEDIVHTTM